VLESINLIKYPYHENDDLRELSSQLKNNRGVLALRRTRPDRLTPHRILKRIDAFLLNNTFV
jgi:transposase